MGGFAAYHFLYRVPQRKSRAYRGTVQRTYHEEAGFIGERPASEQRTYHLPIETEKGKTIDVAVPQPIWNRAEEGAPMKKVAGERYPKVMTKEAMEKREAIEGVAPLGDGGAK